MGPPDSTTLQRRQVMAESIMFVGMDVHTKSIDITTAEQGHDGEVKHYACIGGDLKSLDKAMDKLAKSGKELRGVHEAGPCGFVIARHLKKRGIACAVVSPAGVPKKPGDRVKTDRRDSKTLAIQHRAGSLRAIYIPEPEDEAMRDLVRARGYTSQPPSRSPADQLLSPASWPRVQWRQEEMGSGASELVGGTVFRFTRATNHAGGVHWH